MDADTKALSLPHGTYQATLHVTHRMKEGPPKVLHSEPVTVSWPREVTLITRQALGLEESLGLRAYYVLDPTVHPHEDLKSVSRSALQLAFAQGSELHVANPEDAPWEDIEMVRKERDSREVPVPPSLDPEILVVVSLHGASANVEAAQLRVRVYDLSCRDYNYQADPGPLTVLMHRALLFEEYVEIPRMESGRWNAVLLVDAWQEILRSLVGSPRFDRYRMVLKSGNKLSDDRDGRKLLGLMEASENATAIHGELEKEVLFPTSTLRALESEGQ